MRLPALVGAIPPIDPWIGTSGGPVERVDHIALCDVCRDQTTCLRIIDRRKKCALLLPWEGEPLGAYLARQSPPIIVVCAWCFMAHRWELVQLNRVKIARLVKVERPG